MNSTAAKNAPGSWRDATLAGLPHVLYALMLYGPLLTYDLRTHGLTVLLDPMGNYPRYNYYGPPWFWPQIFWTAVIVLVVVGLWRRVPRWSASWLGYGLLGLRLGGQLSLSDRALLFAAASYEYRRYDGIEPLFLVRREDNQVDARLGLAYLVAPSWTLTPQVAYTYNFSNVQLNEYDRAVASISIRRDF